MFHYCRHIILHHSIYSYTPILLYSYTLVLLACTPATTLCITTATTLCIPTATTLCIPTATTPILLYSYLLHKHMFISYTHYLYPSFQTSVLFTPLPVLLIFLLSINHATSQPLHSNIIQLHSVMSIKTIKLM